MKPCLPASAGAAALLRLSLACFVGTPAFLLSTHIANAQTASTGSIQGRVSNSSTGQYLRNAEITLVGTSLTTVTDDRGEFTLSGVPAGDASISVSYSGLDPVTKTVTVSAGQVAKLDIPLTSEVYVLDPITIAAVREGQAKAIVDQKQASNIKNVIAADAFGTVSEDNVGEFLKFMPGLTIDYVENDARQVRVRGLSAKYASVTVDGNPVASADFNVSTGRGFQFEQVSLSTADAIEVNKTPLADQPADSLAGTINVKSKSALSQSGRRIKYVANVTLNETAFTLDRTIGWDDEKHFKALPGGSLEFSDTFLDGRFGVLAAINHTGTYVEQKIIAGLGRTFDSNAANNETEIPKITQVNWQDGLKPTFRDSILVNLDYKLTPDMIVSLRTSYNAYDAPFHNRNWTLNAATATQTDTQINSFTTTATSATETNNTAVIAGTNFRKYGATFSTNPALVWKINDRMLLDASLAYSRSYQWYDSDAEGFFNIVSARMPGVSWGYTSDLGSEALQVKQGTAGNTGSFLNVANYTNNTTAQTAERDARDDVFNARADFTIEFPDFVVPTTLKIGAASRSLDKEIDNWTKVWTMDVTSTNATRINLANHVDPYSPSFDKGETLTDRNGVVGAAPSLNKWSLYELFAKYNTDPLTVTTAAQQPFFLTATQVGNNLRNKLQNMFDFEEDIKSAYIMAEAKPSKQFRATAGLRLESTDAVGYAYDDIGHVRAAALSGSTDTNNLAYIRARFGSRTAKRQSYDDLFPSMQVRYAPVKDLVFRGAYYRSILRPDAQNIATALIVNDEQTSITTANPNLKPEFADNFDVRVEYYFEPVGVISVGTFYKQIKDIQVRLVTDITDISQVPQDAIDQGFDAQTFVDKSADFTRFANGPDTSVWGFEIDYSQQLAFLPAPFNNFTAFANYTFTDLEEPLLHVGGSGAAKESANFGLAYRQKKFNGQVKFNWVGERVLAATGYNFNSDTGKFDLATGSNSGVIQYEKERLQIDLNLDYKVHRNATVFCNIANLTGAPSVRYAVNENILVRHGAFGAKFTFGVKGSF